MSGTSHRRVRSFTLGAGLILLLVAAAAWWSWRVSPKYGLPYRSAFDKQGASEWIPFGGAWGVQDGAMRNASDQRGAKLVTGSTGWRDYVVDVDVRFLGTGGDVGVIVRSGSEESGVDAYEGYYVGLRSMDDALVAGRADFGWSEAAPVPAPAAIRPLAWFHLHVVAYGCTIAASAQDPGSSKTSYIAISEPACVSSGRIGLRSLATGGEWRNVSVRAATPDDSAALLQKIHSIESPLYPRTEAEYNKLISFVPAPERIALQNNDRAVAIESLRSTADNESKLVSIRGVVTLLHPQLFIQDATGGIAVQLESKSQPTLNLGDEVEVQGWTSPSSNHSIETGVLNGATAHLLWDRSPASPVALDALEGAAADNAGTLVEMDGQVVAEKEKAGRIILDLASGTQAFSAIVDKPTGGLRVPVLAPHSLVRVRGVCVPDERYTQRRTPFVLLLRSTDDIDEIAGAPWWSARRLLEELIIGLALLLVVQAYNSHMQRQKRAAITGERERLAHELHDTLAQTFAGLAFQLHGIRNRLRLRERAPFETLEQQLDAASDFVRRTHQEASLSIVMLKSHSPAVGNLAAALEQSASELTAPGVATVRVIGNSSSYDMPLRIKDALFHIAREALVNAARHASAEKIDITITFEKSRLSLEVTDNGIGFVRDPGCQRLGLKGIEHRAAAIYAVVWIETTPGKGTSIKVSAPIARRPWLSWHKAENHF